MKRGMALLLGASLLWGGTAMAEEKSSYEKATFAGGCFWGIEKYSLELPGVVSTQVGYTGGQVKNPSYQAVCTGLTGHAEAIEITYDSAKIRYEDLVEFFFTHHDPTTLNRQGPDVGSQYRSAVFYHSPAQKAAALKAVETLDRSNVLRHRVVTELAPAGEFYRAEEYHQKYLKKNPRGYCSIVPAPKKVADVLRAALSSNGQVS